MHSLDQLSLFQRAPSIANIYAAEHAALIFIACKLLYPTSVYQRRFRNDWSNFRGIRSVFAIHSLSLSLSHSVCLRGVESKIERHAMLRRIDTERISAKLFSLRNCLLIFSEIASLALDEKIQVHVALVVKLTSKRREKSVQLIAPTR